MSIVSSLNKYTVQLRVGELGWNQKDNESGSMVFLKKSSHTGLTMTNKTQADLRNFTHTGQKIHRKNSNPAENIEKVKRKKGSRENINIEI